MGWCSEEHPEHEGYLIGLVPISDDSRTLREVSYHVDGAVDSIKLQYVCVGCECGWRSPRMFAPSGTEWSPAMVWLAYGSSDEVVAGYEESARKVWRAHVDDVAKNGKPRLRVDEDGFREAWNAKRARHGGKP
jgi:hypothetical protein